VVGLLPTRQITSDHRRQIFPSSSSRSCSTRAFALPSTWDLGVPLCGNASQADDARRGRLRLRPSPSTGSSTAELELRRSFGPDSDLYPYGREDALARRAPRGHAQPKELSSSPRVEGRLSRSTPPRTAMTVDTASRRPRSDFLDALTAPSTPSFRRCAKDRRRHLGLGTTSSVRVDRFVKGSPTTFGYDLDEGAKPHEAARSRREGDQAPRAAPVERDAAAPRRPTTSSREHGVTVGTS